MKNLRWATTGAVAAACLLAALALRPAGGPRPAPAPELPAAPTDPFTADVATLLCRRDLSRCEGLKAETLTPPDACSNPPCRPLAMFGGLREESMLPTVEGCRSWASWLLFLESAVAGRPDIPTCRNFFPAMVGVPLAGREADDFCVLLGQDFSEGGDRFCRELTSRFHVDASRCAASEAFLKGADACREQPNSAMKPSCALRARVREALKRRDPAACGKDPICLAFFRPADCSERG